MKKIKYIMPLIIFFLLGFFLSRGLNHNPSFIPSPLIGKSVPQFQSTRLFYPNQKIDQSVFLNHISILNVFASWCVSCHAEHDVLMQLKRDDSAIQIIGLCYKDHADAVRAWFKKSGNPYHEIINDAAGNIGIDFGIYGTPETFIIDKHGVILGKIVGPISPDTLQNQLMPFFKKIQARE